MIFLTTPEQLVPAALQQGIQLSRTEADIILGYFEGHDYVLLLDKEAGTMRHDLQSGDDNTEDTSYSLREAIQFASDVNEELLRDAENADTVDGKYLDTLNEDQRVLAALRDRISGDLYGQEI